MNMINAYTLTKYLKFKRYNLLEFNLSISRINGLYFVFISAIGTQNPRFNRTLMFTTMFTDDLDALMQIYTFANSEGAVDYEFG